MESKGSAARLVRTVDYWNAVHYKNGGSAKTKHPAGTWQDPSGSLPTVRAMLTARQLNDIWIHGAATLDADMADMHWYGNALTTEVVDLNGQSVDNGTFHNVSIIGNAYGAAADYIGARECRLYLIDNLIQLWAEDCAIVGTAGVPLQLLRESYLLNCFAVEGDITTYISSDTGDRIHITGWKGDLTLCDVAAGGEVYVDGVGRLDVDGTGGTVYVRGDIKVTDLSGGAVTIDDQTSFAQRAAIKTDTAAILVAVTGGAADARFEIGRASCRERV